MAERIAAVLLAGLMLFGGSAAPAHEIGDFGRVKPGVLNDEIIPEADKLLRRLGGQPVSNFNWTDQEREMRDRVYRFLIARDVEDWAFDYEHILIVASLVSSRPTHDDLYYKWLSHKRFASSRVRYNRIADDVGADLMTLPSTFNAICAVLQVDQQRAAAAAGLTDIEVSMRVEIDTRRAENGLYIGRLVGALRYRFASYGYALDHFLVETPQTEAVHVDARLSELAIWVERAERGDFCIADWSRDGWGRDALPGRVLMGDPEQGGIRK